MIKCKEGKVKINGALHDVLSDLTLIMMELRRLIRESFEGKYEKEDARQRADELIHKAVSDSKKTQEEIVNEIVSKAVSNPDLFESFLRHILE